MTRRPLPPRIFVSYRREDTSGHAGRLYDVLAERFGDENVFMDVDTIRVGSDFAEAITKAVASCDAVSIKSPPAPQYSVALSAGNKATSGDSIYEIVGSRVERRNPGELGLELVVRFTNNSPYDDNFWSQSFRLDDDGARRAPTNDLNDVVPGGTTANGDVALAVPEPAKKLALALENQIRLLVELRRSG